MVNLPVTSEQYQPINPEEWRSRLDKRLIQRREAFEAEGDWTKAGEIEAVRRRLAYPGTVTV